MPTSNDTRLKPSKQVRKRRKVPSRLSGRKQMMWIFGHRVLPNIRVEGECWTWKGTKRGKKGYGQVFHNHKRHQIHRWVYVLLIEPVPDELVCDHLCRNTSCINPAHIEIVTAGVNTLRGFGAPAQNKRKTHCSRGHLLGGSNAFPSSGRRCKQCSLDYYRSKGKAVIELRQKTTVAVEDVEEL